MISYSRAPPGACTDATSPSDLPISARAIGELIEIRPCLMSASSSPTIWYVTVRARIQVFQFDRRAEHDAAVRLDGGRIDDLRGGQLRFDLGDAAFDEALLFLGRVVLGVFRQVALRARFRDRIDRPRDARPIFRRCNSSRSISAPRLVNGTVLINNSESKKQP